jgi:hypothetical protein
MLAFCQAELVGGLRRDKYTTTAASIKTTAKVIANQAETPVSTRLLLELDE